MGVWGICEECLGVYTNIAWLYDVYTLEVAVYVHSMALKRRFVYLCVYKLNIASSEEMYMHHFPSDCV